MFYEICILIASESQLFEQIKKDELYIGIHISIYIYSYIYVINILYIDILG